ncbi:hypothetical protein [Brachyspira catarrhinii]|uniref:Ankyrin repeat domain-containing protein n=1 Tax=Brachyspira catarrhinii TaxID=2528966 RepID=A0ABY2TPG4_9SPIR|nr:hypothetical protein [Brachyspira catarrhinii]TKZ29478.1 hypothetical protein EZH24_10975 [Brachyspira catarrhinii]
MIKKITLMTIIILGVIACSKKTFKINVNGNEYIISFTNINDILVEDMEGMTHLMYASILGNLEVVKHLRVFGNGYGNIFILID